MFNLNGEMPPSKFELILTTPSRFIAQHEPQMIWLQNCKATFMPKYKLKVPEIPNREFEVQVFIPNPDIEKEYNKVLKDRSAEWYLF